MSNNKTVNYYDLEQIDCTKLRYVLYVRKSTEDKSRQIRSLPDQIAECKALAKRLHIKLREEDIIKEEGSAKSPSRRSKFLFMLKQIKKGVYDGIIAWNPDRLARNMLEAGQIIDMLDNQVIKDLKFVTHHYTPDANGKMLLGMAFVLSKQYSDKLSQDVTRGVRNRHSEGKSPAPKHGYERNNKTGLYESVEPGFSQMKEAWELRASGVSVEKIVEHLKAVGYFRRVKKNNRKVYLSKQRLSEVFKDPFYYGELVQAGKKISLLEVHPDFQPMISLDLYLKVQALTNRDLKPYKRKRVHAFYPLAKLIMCQDCGHSMVVGPSKGGDGKYRLYFRCDTKGCSRKKKSVRGKVVFNFIYDFLEEGLRFTEKEYNDYLKKTAKVTDEKADKISIEVHSLQGTLKQVSSDKKQLALAIPRLVNDPEIQAINSDRFNELAGEEAKLTNKIKKLQKILGQSDEEKLSLEEFLNLSKNAALIVKSADERVKDVIVRQIFLNLVLKEENIASYQLKEPFKTLFEMRSVKSSRGDWTRTSDLTLPKRAL